MSDPTRQNDQVVTRFAPSPTGALHVGGARTALLNWAFARGRGGRFILRLEDTDLKRSNVESARGVLNDLQWLGLDWDEGPDPAASVEAIDPYDTDQQRGDHGPYCQSQRLEAGIYQPYIDQLKQAGRAYEEDGAVRFRMPDHPITVHDAILGEVTVTPENSQDFVIQKTDGYPTYHFAVVIDDALMNVSHVIRGQEHLSNTPKHWALQEALGLPHPTYAHFPLIFNAAGAKMSKRDKAKAAREAAKRHLESSSETTSQWFHQLMRLSHEGSRAMQRAGMEVGNDDPDEVELEQFLAGDTDSMRMAYIIALNLQLKLPEIDVADFRKAGYLPGVLCNYLALLGWNPGNDLEKFDLDFLVKNFSLDRAQKSNARFDREKLASFNADALAALPLDEFKDKLWNLPANKPEFEIACDSGIFTGPDDPRFEQFAAVYQPRSSTLRDPLTAGWFFFEDDEKVIANLANEKKARKALEKNDGEGYAVLEALLPELDAIPAADWNPENLERTIAAHAERRELKLGKVAQPLRAAVSGSSVSPPIFDTLAILGRDTTLKRIQRCLESQPSSD